MINPNDTNECIFIHEESLYQFSYVDDDLTFYCFNDQKHYTETEDILPILYTLTLLGLDLIMNGSK
jgi:hypothetical protein